YASMMVSAGESPEWVAEQMGHLDGRLVAQVYGRWLRPAKLQPGRAAAEMYAVEWEEANSLVSLQDPAVSEEEASQEDQEVALRGDLEDDEDDL
ncbi:MAG TPA: hypothetical protein VGE20_19975, partial [Ramlibacter sp.]